ncbi:hypothetical protein LTR08_007508 [Meristemomyces frigidus]|nr:hypothetical protein LTR08_007508 [Meristemomyces frigidus]
MSVVFTICVPLETVRAIQNGETESVLNEISTVSTGPYCLIHDITRNVVTAVSAVAYNIVPKPNPADPLGLGHDFSTTSSQDGLKWSPFSMQLPPQTPVPRAYTPDISDGVLAEPYYIDITIRDLMDHDEISRHVAHTATFQWVVDMYEERTGFLSSTLAFTNEDDEPVQKCCSGLYEASIEKLGFYDGMVVLAKPKGAKTTAPAEEITIILQDLMLSEVTISLNCDADLNDMMNMYEQRTGLDSADLRFTFEGEELVQKSCGLVDELGMETGSVITVAPAQYLTIIFRDQMLRETRIKLNKKYSISEFVKEYQDTVGNPSNVYYSLSNGEVIENTKLGMSHLPEDLGINDGSIVNVHPSPKKPQVARARFRGRDIATPSSFNCASWQSDRSLCWE